MKYFQVELELMGYRMVTWIEARGAKVGNEIELLPHGDFWRVTKVFEPGMEEKVLFEQQKLNRNSFSSIQYH